MWAMAKYVNWFSHDSNARNDEKILKLRMAHGAAGYGVYFMLIERLRDERDYLGVKDYNMLAFDLRVDSKLIKSVIEDFGLFAFTANGECFYSESFNSRMAIKDETSKARSEAGRKGAASRWGFSENGQKMANAIKGDGKRIANAKQMPSKNMASKDKLSKGKLSTSTKNLEVNKRRESKADPVLKAYCEIIEPVPSTHQIEIMDAWEKDGMDPEVIIEAFKSARDNGARSFQYVAAIIKNLILENVRTMPEYEARILRHEQKKARKSSKNKQGKVSNRGNYESAAASTNYDEAFALEYPEIKDSKVD